ncbi:glycosyltransferase family 2 protein [Cryobacterium lyxosi]|uniref:Glycosyltransferase family 2 protein n=1 Tax=Cryobacterium lyxosi TaxID=1259228 RepID=A0A4R8ZL97_9MICO|nr:glycosyltransferase family 2 protein [Cryobacterium lyxosi]TFD29219.1 glycosyltransferase family 2 protein [Cryobacterium lyxosi]
MSPSVLLVTVAFNSSSVMNDFLKSIEVGTSHEHEVVVVDNASSDLDTLREIVARHPSVRLHELAQNHGYGGGMNAGVKFAGSSSDYILVANPDVSFLPGSIDTLIDSAEHTPSGGAFGPAILNADGTLYPSARELPSLRTGIGHALFGRAWPENPWTRGYRVPVSAADGQRHAGWLSGACVLIRTGAFEQLSGFDTSYFMYFEDVDLGERLTAHGWSNVYLPEAQVMHSGAHSTSQSPTSMGQAHHDSAYRYLSRRYSGPHLALLRGVLRLGLYLRRRWLTRKH